MVLEISLPEYKFSLPLNESEKVFLPTMNAYVPKAFVDNEPDFEKIGKKLDRVLIEHFLGKEVAVRALSSDKHKGKSADEVIQIIQKIGHDRYDPDRKGDRYENVDKKHIDFFALDFKIKKEGEYFKYLLEPFYYWPIIQTGKPSKIDIAIVYDLGKLAVVEHRYEGRNDIKRDGFVFKDPDNKKDAILGIIKIT